MNKHRSISVAVAVLGAALLVLTAGGVLAQSNPSGRPIPYSGHLTDPSGQPVADGRYDFIFTLYASEKDDHALWSEMQSGLDVKSGNLNVVLGQNVPLSKDVADRKELWLSVSVRGPQDADFTLLNPRHNLNAPNAVNALICPHSHFEDAWSGSSTAYGLVVDNSGSTGDGIRAYSSSTATNFGGIYAINTSSGSPGAGGNAIYASSYAGYSAYLYGGSYRALYASSDQAWYTAIIENRGGSSYAGMYMDGTLWVTGAKTGYVTDAAINDGPEPLETGDVVVITGAADPLAGKIPVIRVRKAIAADSTAVVGVVDQGVAMQQGAQDKVAIPAVVGHEAHLSDNTAIKPGGYLLIVTLGAYKGVKVDATSASIHAGDLLVASGSAGYAKASTDAKMGTVIGKALGDLKSGTGLIPVMVTLK